MICISGEGIKGVFDVASKTMVSISPEKAVTSREDEISTAWKAKILTLNDVQSMSM